MLLCHGRHFTTFKDKSKEQTKQMVFDDFLLFEKMDEDPSNKDPSVHADPAIYPYILRLCICSRNACVHETTKTRLVRI